MTIVKEDTMCYKCQHFRDLEKSDDPHLVIGKMVGDPFGVCKHASETIPFCKTFKVPYFCYLCEEALGKGKECPNYIEKEMTEITGLWED